MYIYWEVRVIGYVHILGGESYRVCTCTVYVLGGKIMYNLLGGTSTCMGMGLA